MAPRQHVPQSTQDDVLVACLRKCCLCYYLDDRTDARKGQIAHLNGKPDDGRFENLVWLCFDHHDEFDSTTRQSKGLTRGEVERHRDRLILELAAKRSAAANQPAHRQAPAEGDQDGWRFPLWLTANQPELFAYRAPGADGICAIERVDLPDGRVVIACIQVPGNPGRSVTNSAEYIHEQVCDRFDLRPDQVVWLEHYDSFNDDEWKSVGFAGDDEPTWTKMTPLLWSNLGLSPLPHMTSTPAGDLRSKLQKHFPWPPADRALGWS